mmetsp:Transcript_12775/g.28836  ORF Transcript_12775/g.28836 Transcript_12775/m.28836 type:complete len:166 (+) Transcript_12775:1835-2332(+)
MEARRTRILPSKSSTVNGKCLTSAGFAAASSEVFSKSTSTSNDTGTAGDCAIHDCFAFVAPRERSGGQLEAAPLLASALPSESRASLIFLDPRKSSLGHLLGLLSASSCRGSNGARAFFSNKKPRQQSFLFCSSDGAQYHQQKKKNPKVGVFLLGCWDVTRFLPR